jgi:DNA-binding transcriptional MerR regulator
MTQRQSQVIVYEKQSTPVKAIVKGSLNIHQFATICRTTVRTIRFYDKKGILKPASVDQYTGYRYYHPHQAREFFRIKLLQTFGLPLKEISKTSRQNSKDSLLDKKLSDLKAEIEEKKRQYGVLQTTKQDLIDGKMEQHLKIQNVGPFFVFGKEFSDARYDRINADIFDLHKKAKELGLSAKMIQHVLYLEPHEYVPNQTRLRISLILSRLPKQVPDGYYVEKIPSQKVLAYKYKGPYEYLTFVHREMYSIAKKRGFVKGYSFDVHTKGPLNATSEYDYETLIGYPITSS